MPASNGNELWCSGYYQADANKPWPRGVSGYCEGDPFYIDENEKENMYRNGRCYLPPLRTRLL
jgi:hypothetical protein